VILGLATVFPFAVLCLLLWRAGAFEPFWFWTFTYAREYGTMQSFSESFSAFADKFSQIASGSWSILVLAVLGLLAVGETTRVAHRPSSSPLFWSSASSPSALVFIFANTTSCFCCAPWHCSRAPA